jgi:DNA topoisomerase IA
MVIADCDVRRMMEQNMERIAQGLTNKDTAAEDTLSFMRPIYDELNRSKGRWLT